MKTRQAPSEHEMPSLFPRSWRERGIIAALMAGICGGCASGGSVDRRPTFQYQRNGVEAEASEQTPPAPPADALSDTESGDAEWERLQASPVDAGADGSPLREQQTLSTASRLIQDGHLAGARRLLMIAAGESRTDPGLCLALARVNEAMGHWQDAAVWYAAADEAEFAAGWSSEGPRWRRQRARCHYRDGSFAVACEAWEATLSPDDRRASMAELTEYADACLRIEEYDTAQALLEQVSERSSGRIVDVELLRATCALRRGDLSRAREVLSLAMDGWPNDTRLGALAERLVAASEGGDSQSPASDDPIRPSVLPATAVEPAPGEPRP